MKVLYMLLFMAIPLLGFSQNSIEAGTIIDQISRGEKIELRNIKITGTLDLTRLQNLQATNENGNGGEKAEKFE